MSWKNNQRVGTFAFACRWWWATHANAVDPVALSSTGSGENLLGYTVEQGQVGGGFQRVLSGQRIRITGFSTSEMTQPLWMARAGDTGTGSGESGVFLSDWETYLVLLYGDNVSQGNTYNLVDGVTVMCHATPGTAMLPLDYEVHAAQAFLQVAIRGRSLLSGTIAAPAVPTWTGTRPLRSCFAYVHYCLL